MKNPIVITSIAAVILVAAIGFMYLKPTSFLSVDKAAIALGIDKHEPLRPGTVFKSNVGKLYCYSKIRGMNATENHVVHRWIYNGKALSNVTLKLKSKLYRTYSTKTITKDMVGDWEVEIVSPDGKVLKTLEFVIE